MFLVNILLLLLSNKIFGSIMLFYNFSLYFTISFDSLILIVKTPNW